MNLENRLSDKDTVMLLCTPSLTIMDNWLSVINELKNIKGDLDFVCVIPKARTVDEIDLENVLTLLAGKIFNKIIFRSYADKWVIVKSFKEAKEVNTLTLFEKLLLKVIKIFEKKSTTKTVSIILKKIFQKYLFLKTKKYCFDYSSFKKDNCILLYDVHVETKPQLHDIIDNFKSMNKFSILHGVNIVIDGGLISNSRTKPYQGSLRTDLIHYLFSEKERDYCQKYLGLDNSIMKVVGIPRHETAWINHIIASCSDNLDIFGKDFVFVISRPSTTVYMAPHRKRQYLEDIKRLVFDELGRNIVIKLHPKEYNDGLCEEVFGKDLYGKRWFYSNLHPFVLGSHCSFAISLLSGVAVDMIAMGVPTIERCSLKGLPEYEHEGYTLRDENGEPVRHLRYWGLVLGASTYEQMKKHADDIINDKSKVIDGLKNKYNELFAKIDEPNKVMAKDILEHTAFNRVSSV